MTERSMTAVHGELEALIGHTGPVVRGTVLRRDIQRYAMASGEDPREDMAAPPVMLSSVIEWGAGPPLEHLRPDGTGVGRESWLPLGGLRLMGGGQDLWFHRPVPAGTEFVAQPELESVTLKEGGAGAMVLMVITTVYRTTGGEDLVTCRETLIAR